MFLLTAGFGSGGGDPNAKPGDWKCSCGASNFARRDSCFKCSEPKPEGKFFIQSHFFPLTEK